MLRLAKQTAIVQQLGFINDKRVEMLAFADIEILKKAMHNSFEKFRSSEIPKFCWKMLYGKYSLTKFANCLYYCQYYVWKLLRRSAKK